MNSNTPDPSLSISVPSIHVLSLSPSLSLSSLLNPVVPSLLPPTSPRSIPCPSPLPSLYLYLHPLSLYHPYRFLPHLPRSTFQCVFLSLDAEARSSSSWWCVEWNAPPLLLSLSSLAFTLFRLQTQLVSSTSTIMSLWIYNDVFLAISHKLIVP